jgi:hypothetical protein
MQSSLVLLPVIAYLLFVLVFYPETKDRSISMALVKSHLVLFTFVAISTELLSLLNEVKFSFLLLSWLLFLLVGFVLAARRLGKLKFPLPEYKKASLIQIILIGAILFILVTTFFTAIVYPPNTVDSMTYHMPRVLHWINNNSVAFYPTDITRQNYLMPLAEFAIMHLQVLTGGDCFANLVQWVSFLVLICLGAVVAEELGLNRKLQLLTAVMIATLPMAILQSSGTQNDLVVSVFLMSFALYMLRLREQISAENLLFAGISLGLALLTKGTAYIFGATLGLSLAVPLLIDRKQHFAMVLKALAALILVVIIALSLNTGHIGRNFKLYGGLLPTEAADYRNQETSVATLASNILRNGALHLGTPNEQINLYEFNIISSLLGEKLSDPKTTLHGDFYIPYDLHEDTAGNLIHMLILIFGVLILSVHWRQGHGRRTVWYAMGIITGAILFCWLLKWQIWSSRLHTPLFALAAPLLAIIITKGIASKRIAYIISLLLVLYSVPFALGNSSRSVVSLEWKNKDRKRLYFQNWQSLYSEYQSAIQVLGMEPEEEVGLYMGYNDWEYPFWVFAEQKAINGKPISFKSVGVNDVSRTISGDVFLPTFVIATKSIEGWEHAQKYAPIYNSKHLNVMKKLASR